MAYKLYINNKLFNGIGNNNYNKGTIAINGTVYQFDNNTYATQFNIYYHYLQPESQSVSTYTVNDGYAILAGDIPAMTNTNYLLDGYYYDSSFTTPVTVGDIVDKNTDIYLNWISKTYLFKVSGVYNNPSGYVKLIENDKYINDFSYVHSISSSVQKNTSTASISTPNSDIIFNGFAGGQGRNRSQSFGSDNSRYFIINPKYDGKILFYYKIGSGSSAIDNPYSGNTATIVFCELQNYSFGDNPGNKILSSVTDTVISTFDANTVYESGEFTVNKETYYLIYSNASATTPRLLIAGFKFVAD